MNLRVYFCEILQNFAKFAKLAERARKNVSGFSPFISVYSLVMMALLNSLT